MYIYGLFTLLLVVYTSYFPSTYSYELTYNSANGHYYKIYEAPSGGITQSAASNIAKSKYINGKPGYLVTIGDAAESQFLVQFFNTRLPPYNDSTLAVTAKPGTYPSFWVGAMRPAAEQSWYWYATNRQSITFYTKDKCATGSYCNLMSRPEPTDSCMKAYLFNQYGPGLGLWKSADCTSKIEAYLIEFDDSANCAKGFTYSAAKGWCVDVDECATTGCGSAYTCVNTVGSYQCIDVDECANKTICENGYTCQNIPGSYTCQDINECAVATNPCGPGYACNNVPGTYTCSDIDECAANPSPCTGANTMCVNTDGSYQCNTQWNRLVNKQDTSLVLDVASLDIGANVIVTYRKSTDRDSQLWMRTQEGFIINKATGFVLDVSYGNFVAGNTLTVWTRKPLEFSFNQLWSFNNAILSSSSADYVVDMPKYSAYAGVGVVIWYPKDTDNLNQRWKWEDPDATDNGDVSK